jgi:hypothetical protein
MHEIFFLVRIYPYWTIPFAMVLAQLAIFFRRRGSGLRFPLWGMVGILIATAIIWVVFRGDLHSDQWVRWAIS